MMGCLIMPNLQIAICYGLVRPNIYHVFCKYGELLIPVERRPGLFLDFFQGMDHFSIDDARIEAEDIATQNEIDAVHYVGFETLDKDW